MGDENRNQMPCQSLGIPEPTGASQVVAFTRGATDRAYGCFESGSSECCSARGGSFEPRFDKPSGEK
ncbi:MAG: hypothetical protein ACI95C_001251 [Pseudohongiellaceae bacterium]|jgi:hypothetical protein